VTGVLVVSFIRSGSYDLVSSLMCELLIPTGLILFPQCAPE
jgi:hypothetical protein